MGPGSASARSHSSEELSEFPYSTTPLGNDGRWGSAADGEQGGAGGSGQRERAGLIK